MARTILLIDGHPDPDPARFCHALADAYARGAAAGGHRLRRLTIAELELPPLRSTREFETAPAGAEVIAAQEAIAWAEHLVLVYPLWLGTLPALLKAFFEQTLRPGFAFDPARGPFSAKLKGRSARVVVTMGMPTLAYRLFYRAHSLKSLERNILKFSGFAPVRSTLFGGVEGVSAARRAHWLARLEALGRRGL